MDHETGPKRVVRRKALSTDSSTDDSTNSSTSPGDNLEYSLTAGVKHQGIDYWVKCGATIAIRNGETTRHAQARIHRLVEGELDSRITELTQ